MARIVRRKPSYIPVRNRINPLKGGNVGEIDYKNVELLEKFIQDRGKIRSRKITGVTVQEQRKVSRAIKNARELALLPFVGVSSTKKRGRRNG